MGTCYLLCFPIHSWVPFEVGGGGGDVSLAIAHSHETFNVHVVGFRN